MSGGGDIGALTMGRRARGTWWWSRHRCGCWYHRQLDWSRARQRHMAVIPWALAIAGRRAVAAGVRRGLATGAGRFIVTAAWGMVEALRYSTVGRRFGMFRDWGW